MNKNTLQIVSIWKRLESMKFNQYIAIDREAVKVVAKEHAQDAFAIHPWRGSVYAKREWAFAAQEIFANCFNAHYNVFEKPDTKYTVANPVDVARPFTGAFAMQCVINQYFNETIPHASDLERHVKSPEAMAKFFRGIVPIPSPELKQECGAEFVEHLKKIYQGNPLNLLEEAMTGEYRGRKALRAFNKGKGLVELLADGFGAAYRDVQCLKIDGFDYFLHFNKRAQLTVIMLHDRALYSNGILPLVEDIDEVGPIADYELPKALRHLGILKYSEELAVLVDSWKEIPKDSQMEIEIRATTVVACYELLNALNKLRSKIFERNYLLNICHLDLWLWLMGKNAKHLRPHLTRTSAY